MKRPKGLRAAWWVVLALFLTVGAAGPALASEPTPTPTPTPTAKPSPTPQPGSVAEAARQARAGTGVGESAAPTRTPIVISNENLAELAARGTLTEVTVTSDPSTRRPVSATGSAAGPDDASAPAATEEETKKTYWRGRYKGQKDLVASIKGEIATLDQEIPGLWNQFYAWDDPAYRDGVIKVRLDEALSRREELAKQLPEEEAKLPEILNEARRDGALPGWFRDLK